MTPTSTTPEHSLVDEHELLTLAANWCAGTLGNADPERLRKAAKAIEKLIADRARLEWQGIENVPLPLDDRVRWVLVYIPQPDDCGQHFEVTCALADGRICGIGDDVATHWMHLPEPPNALTGKDTDQ